MTSQPIEIALGDALRAKNMTIATAESCTGGLVGHLITNAAGSSDYFLGGVIAYAYHAKVRRLGVQWQTLETHGAVSQETVAEMAAGVRSIIEADIGISVSGIAGPGGGTPEKPVGLVWFGLAAPDGSWTRQHHFDGDREEVKGQAARFALQFVLDYLDGGLAGG